MNCPVCRKEPMVVLELNEVEIDFCLACQGIWLDAGELELLLEDADARDYFLQSYKVDKRCSEKRIRCPICQKKMDKVLCGDDTKVTIDKCKNNDGLWFDSGELEQVLILAGPGEDNRVMSLLKDIFNK